MAPPGFEHWLLKFDGMGSDHELGVPQNYGRIEYAYHLMARDAGVKPIMRAMKSGRPFLMLPDMDFGPRESIFVPFFGIPSATLTAPARLTAATQGQVIPVVTRFLPDYRGWKVIFYPAWDDYPGDDMSAATRRMNAFIEARILEEPSEYFWSHKRFKTRPPGVAGFYN
jgi:KDO2-lipid IV(A) lauroyltransferase